MGEEENEMPMADEDASMGEMNSSGQDYEEVEMEENEIPEEIPNASSFDDGDDLEHVMTEEIVIKETEGEEATMPESMEEETEEATMPDSMEEEVEEVEEIVPVVEEVVAEAESMEMVEESPETSVVEEEEEPVVVAAAEEAPEAEVEAPKEEIINDMGKEKSKKSSCQKEVANEGKNSKEEDSKKRENSKKEDPKKRKKLQRRRLQKKRKLQK